MSPSKKRIRNALVSDFFVLKSSRKARTKKAATNEQAEELATRLGEGVRPSYLSEDGASWFILVKDWFSSSSCPDDFQTEWDRHPTERHALKLYGKTVHEKRWSQCWGNDLRYSGSVSTAKPLSESKVIQQLVHMTNEATSGIFHDGSSREKKYNTCLQNWYTPEDSIGLHADDERELRQDVPIFSISWGGTRRFLFRPKRQQQGSSSIKDQKIELWLEDGDLLVMGGTCQQTHKHEVPKLRKTLDPPTSNRINYTIRAFNVAAISSNNKKKQKTKE